MARLVRDLVRVRVRVRVRVMVMVRIRVRVRVRHLDSEHLAERLLAQVQLQGEG